MLRGRSFLSRKLLDFRSGNAPRGVGEKLTGSPAPSIRLAYMQINEEKR